MTHRLAPAWRYRTHGAERAQRLGIIKQTGALIERWCVGGSPEVSGEGRPWAAAAAAVGGTAARFVFPLWNTRPLRLIDRANARASPMPLAFPTVRVVYGRLFCQSLEK